MTNERECYQTQISTQAECVVAVKHFVPIIVTEQTSKHAHNSIAKSENVSCTAASHLTEVRMSSVQR